MPGIRKIWEQLGEKSNVWKRIRERSKSDWAVLALVGVLLLVIALPTGKGESSFWNGTASDDTASGSEAGKTPFSSSSGEGAMGAAGIGDGSGAGENVQEKDRISGTYVTYMEKKLEAVLSQMEGVGRVTVMLTVLDEGEAVVEKDASVHTTVTSESDSAGGNRTISENSSEEQTIYVEGTEGKVPYIQKEKLPTAWGVVVVAEGAASPSVVSDISESVQALLPVEAHRIKVVKMCSKEE